MNPFSRSHAQMARACACSCRPTLQRLAALTLLTLGGTAVAAIVPFYATTEAARWEVATNVGGVDGQFSSFPTDGFTQAQPVIGRHFSWPT